MLREAIKAAQEALDEVYAALDDEDNLTSDVRERLFTTLAEAESAYEAALRLLPEI